MYNSFEERAVIQSVSRNHDVPGVVVGVGSDVLVALCAAWRYLRCRRNQKWLDSKWFLRLLVAAAPLGFIAIETGWTVTEVGRQPFIIAGIMRTAEAVTPVPYLTVPLFTFSLVYLFLAFVVVFLLLRQFRQSPRIARNRLSDTSIDGSVRMKMQKRPTRLDDNE